MLIQHSDFLLNQTQKFAAIILCYELYRNEPIATNPLAPVFMHLLVSYLFKIIMLLLVNECVHYYITAQKSGQK